MQLREVPSSINRFLERSAETEPIQIEEQGYPREEWLNPNDIILDQGTQSRIHEDRDRIDDYARDMKAGDWDFERRPLPEAMIAEDGKLYAIDCHHRVKAAVESLHPGRLMLFLVHKGALAQARIWSASANTLHGLAADNSPQGVRKRIEMFLDNIELLSPEQYQEEFLKVPDLTEKERKHGKFSNRTIARYLRLRPGQDVTVGNIKKEREIAAKILQHKIGDRVEIVIPEGIDPSKHPDGLAQGEAGTIHDKDRKSLYVIWDRHPGVAYPISPDFVKPSDKPKPPPFNPPRHTPPPSFSSSSNSTTSGRSGVRSQEPRTESREQRVESQPQAQESQSNTGLRFNEGDRVEIINPNSYFYQNQGIISSFTDSSRTKAIIIVDEWLQRTPPIVIADLKLASETLVEPPQIEVEDTPVQIQETVISEQPNLKEAVRLVLANLPYLERGDLEALQGAIASYDQYLDFHANSDDEEEQEPEITTKRCKHQWSNLYQEPSDDGFKRIYFNGMDAMNWCSKCGAIGKRSESGSILQVPQKKWAKHKQDAERWAANLGKFSEVQEVAQ